MPEPQCLELRVTSLESPDNDLFYHLSLESPQWQWRPGQFAMLRPTSWRHEPLWARPFSISDQDTNGLHFFFQRMGSGTDLLSQLRPGDLVTVWGPLGNGFTISHTTPTMILAGGMGLAPFMGLIRHHPIPQNLELFFGHRQPLANYPFSEIEDRILAWQVREQGPEDLEKLFRAIEVKIKGYSIDGNLLACGPLPFLRRIQKLALDHNANTQLSLENRMACGVGACLGCTVPTKSGELVQACTQGPVFKADAVDLSGEL